MPSESSDEEIRFENQGPSSNKKQDALIFILKTTLLHCSNSVQNINDWKQTNPRVVRALMVVTCILAAISGWTYFYYAYLYSSGSTFITWFPGIMSTIGFVWINTLPFPGSDSEGSISDANDRLTKKEFMFVIALCFTALPVIFALFFLSVDIKESYSDGIGWAMFIQTTLILLGAVGSSYFSSTSFSSPIMLY